MLAQTNLPAAHVGEDHPSRQGSAAAESTVERQFLKDVSQHAMTVYKDEDVYRHIRFGRPDSGFEAFHLITWPGHLCYTGDMGTYVFQRTHDMFDFFRRPDHCRYTIDMRYWAEKVQAGDKSSNGNGVTEFSKALFDSKIREWLDDFVRDEMEEAEELAETELCMAAMDDLRKAVEREVIGADSNDVRCFDAANDFQFGASDSEAWSAYYGDQKTFEFVDFWEVDCTEYTHRFKWCCLALSWAMQVYDKSKAVEAAPVRDPRVPDMFEVQQ
jgi:hypothetical protein